MLRPIGRAAEGRKSEACAESRDPAVRLAPVLVRQVAEGKLHFDIVHVSTAEAAIGLGQRPGLDIKEPIQRTKNRRLARAVGAMKVVTISNGTVTSLSARKFLMQTD